MALVDDILSGNWVTGLAIGVGAVVVLPLAAPVLRPLAKTAIKGGILAYRGGAGLVEGIGEGFKQPTYRGMRINGVRAATLVEPEWLERNVVCLMAGSGSLIQTQLE